MNKLTKLLVFVAIIMGAGQTLLGYANEALDVAVSQPSTNGVYLVSGNWDALKRSWNNLSLTILDNEQKPVEAAVITLKYDMVGMPMDPPISPIIEKGNGVYETRVFLGMRGSYKFDFTIDKDGEQDTFSTTQVAH